MPTATPSKTTTAKAPAKRRTRKSPAKTVTRTVKIKSSKRPSAARLITMDRYVKDIQTRWAIHQYEVRELFAGLPGYFNFVKTQYAKLNLS